MENKEAEAKEFSPKSAILVFFFFSLLCMAIIFIFVTQNIFSVQDFLSFNHIHTMLIQIFISTFLLLLFGIALTHIIPSSYIDDTNKGYQNYSIVTIFLLMFLGAFFEELFFRGIILNVLTIFIDNKWIAIIITTLLFVSLHVQYFKKPVMLLNIMVPGLVFGWIYIETSNILAPFIIHFILNIGMTLLFKYNLLRLKE